MSALKKITAFCTVFAMIIGISSAACAEGTADNLCSTAEGAVVTEITTGQVLYEYNSHERLPMASVTKLMCLLIWAEEMEKGTFGMDTVITATARANAMDGSVIWLNVGGGNVCIRYDTLGRYRLRKRCLCGGMRTYSGHGRNVRGANEQKGAGARNERYALRQLCRL